MKKAMVMIIALAIAAMAGMASAADNTTINVSAQVQGNCTIVAASGPVNLDFGAIDPTTFSDTTINDSFDFRCTKDVTYHVSIDGAERASGVGLARTMNGAIPGNTLPYTLTPQSNPTGTSRSAAIPVTYTVAATLLAVDVQAAAADSYSELNIPVTITP